MQRNHLPITQELCEQNRLLFFPETEEEAAFIQRALFKRGYEWGKVDAGGKPQKVQNLEECVQTGMVLKDGKLYFGPVGETFNAGVLCTTSQLDENYVAMPSPSFLKKFNELALQVQEIREQIAPKTLDKKPSGGGPAL